MPRYGNQTLVNIMKMKRKSIAFDSSRLMLKLIENEGCKYNDEMLGLFVQKLSFLWSKNCFFLFFVIREFFEQSRAIQNSVNKRYTVKITPAAQT